MDQFQKYINLNLNETLVEYDKSYQLYTSLKTSLIRLQDTYELRLQDFTRVATRTE